MLALLELGEDALFLAFPLEATQCVLEALLFSNVHDRHERDHLTLTAVAAVLRRELHTGSADTSRSSPAERGRPCYETAAPFVNPTPNPPPDPPRRPARRPTPPRRSRCRTR